MGLSIVLGATEITKPDTITIWNPRIIYLPLPGDTVLTPVFSIIISQEPGNTGVKM